MFAKHRRTHLRPLAEFYLSSALKPNATKSNRGKSLPKRLLFRISCAAMAMPDGRLGWPHKRRTESNASPKCRSHQPSLGVIKCWEIAILPLLVYSTVKLINYHYWLTYLYEYCYCQYYRAPTCIFVCLLVLGLVPADSSRVEIPSCVGLGFRGLG